MCLGIAGQIIEFLPESRDLARALKPGDWVLIHVGFAIAKMDEDEAKASMAFLQGMGEAFTNEMAAAWGEGDDENESKDKE